MNIAVLTSKGRVIVRPDTTRVKDGEDVYLPEFVNDVEWSPVLYARVTKSGRSVLPKFAGRYFDSYNLGILLYPADFIDGSEEGYACASCLDHTSFLLFPVYLPIVLGKEDNLFRLFKGDSVLFETAEGTREMIENAISEASKYIYFRSGDILAIELKPRELLCRREDGTVEVSATFCKNKTIEFKISF